MSRLRLVRDQNFRFNKSKKSAETQCKSSTNDSEDGTDGASNFVSTKKQPLISKLKPTTAKLQVGVKASDNHGVYMFFNITVKFV